jgi:hypothetical protein
MSGKGSRQRPGEGYAEGWDAVFSNKIQAAPADSYSKADRDFHKFWYGHMENDQMIGMLSTCSYAAARYVWDAAMAKAKKED